MKSLLTKVSFFSNYFNVGPNVVFGMNCTIGRGAVIKNSSVGSRTIIGMYPSLFDCLVLLDVVFTFTISLPVVIYLPF